LILLCPDPIDKASLALSDAQTKIALGQQVDPEPLLKAISDLMDYAADLELKVEHCELWHDDDDDDEAEGK
jgi:hypothetical protein